MAVAIGDRAEAFGNWLSGFVDGEGCFGIYCYRKGKIRSFDPGVLSFEFAIQLREDDRQVLEDIRTFLGCGTVGRNSKERARKCGLTNARDQVSFKCRRVEDLVGKVVPQFNQFPLRSKKARDFAIWKKALDLQVECIRLRGEKMRPIAVSPGCAEIRSRILGLAVDLREGRNPGLQRGRASLVPIFGKED